MNSNFSKGVIGTVVFFLFFSGYYLVQANFKTKMENSAEEYLTKQLDEWKNGKLNNRLWGIIPSDFEGDLREWKDYKLSSYFIEKIKARSRYVSKRRHGIWYYFYKLSPAYIYVYADVELTMEDPDGYPKTYNIRYRMEPQSGDKWLITKGPKIKLF